MFENIFLENYFWIYKILFGLFLITIFELILPLISKLIKRKLSIEKSNWEFKFKKIFYTPIKFLIWILIFDFIVTTLAVHFKLLSLLPTLNKFISISIILDIVWLLIKWKKEIQNQLIIKSQKTLDRTSVEFVGKMLSILLIFIAFLIILQKLGINILPLIAFGGVGAAAFALASKDVLANFFGGLMLYITRPFNKNDFVEIPSLNVSGHVEHIGWYCTCIRELEKVPVYVPNSVFSNLIIKNCSRRTHRRFEETIKIRYLDFSKITKIIEDVKKVFKENKLVDQSLAPYVYFTAYNDYSLDIMIKVYTHTTDLEEFLKFREEILFQLKNILEKEGADFPYPITSVDFLNQPKK